MSFLEYRFDLFNSDDQAREECHVAFEGTVVDGDDQGTRAGFLLKVSAHCYTDGDEYGQSMYDATMEWFVSETDDGALLFEVSDKLSDPLTRFGLCVGTHLVREVYDAAVTAYRESKEMQYKWYAFGRSLRRKLPDLGVSVAWRLLKCSRKLIPVL